MAVAGISPTSLLDLLSNTLILYHTCPYIPISGLLNLAATSKSFQDLIYQTPNVFRYLDLSSVKGGAIDFDPIDPGGEIWRSERMDEAVTEEDFYCGPLRGIFSMLRRKGVLQDVQTLILDGLSVPAELVREIICETYFNVRILSIRGVKNLNEGRLQQVLQYAVRRTRPEGTPKLKGLYFFGTKPTALYNIAAGYLGNSLAGPTLNTIGVTNSVGAQLGMQWNQLSRRALATLGREIDPWYRSSGKLLDVKPGVNRDWRLVLQQCRGLIAFDAVLCRGPRHWELKPTEERDGHDGVDKFFDSNIQTSLATVALGPAGCQICHSTPEGTASCGSKAALHQLPLLAPPPRHSSSVKAAQIIPSGCESVADLKFYARCWDCLFDRWCEGCNKFWCESCYQRGESNTYTHLQRVEVQENEGTEGLQMGIKRDCFECGKKCLECNSVMMRKCRKCRGFYCIEHNEGSTASSCDWCQMSGRRTRELY